ncbi:helix-turn-helix domain-containing protein [Paraburkholderia tagetis]|uniref:Helix-turn-helix domain-containing protein n=1 Tax=Paraburkholderia tagetis TaxID=2913261 RepID=A0A9X1RVF6_9BURK|nr:helix-turn-helix domain-containing protein [Paraburkholderia tagetis]MCG5076622.1 helix-turn-helix domain-containing protein [Paraburkholderia tagetis]
MSRRKPELQAIDVSMWPTVAYTELDEAGRRTFEMRQQAVVRYAAGESVKAIEEATGVNRRQLYRWLERAMLPHPDGRPLGFRALLRYARIAEYVRTQDVQISGGGYGGAAGALSQLLERYPALAGWLLQQVKQRKVLLEQIHTNGRLRTRLRGLQALHDNFLRRCRAAGLTAADYPFNTAGHAIRSLSRLLKAEILRSFGTAARSAGASHLKGLPRQHDEAGAPVARRPYHVVEFDGHRLDIRLKVVVRDPLGFEHAFEMERVWLLVIIDVCTRAVLGYHIVMAREYNRYDVIKTIEKALEPHGARAFTIAGLAYGPHEGFPSQRLPELAYATWEWIRLDNAKANLAKETLTALCEFVGCLADAGPKYSPDERPYIERFFGTISSLLSSRLPGYTGSHPRDLRRSLADPKGDLRLYVSIDELEELVEYAIASYNGTPHSGLNNATPLEAIEYFVRGRQTMVTWLAEHHRRTLCLMQSARHCRVRAYLDQGVRPHINLHGVRYTSHVLANSAHLIGQNLLIYLNADDLRCVRAFMADGTELGVLDAQGAWRVVPHNLKLRQEIRRQRGQRRSRDLSDVNPVEAYVQDKLARARKNRRAATELAHATRLLASAPTVRTPVGPKVPGPTVTALPPDATLPVASPTSGVADAVPRTPVRPKKLVIGTGQVF